MYSGRVYWVFFVFCKLWDAFSLPDVAPRRAVAPWLALAAGCRGREGSGLMAAPSVTAGDAQRAASEVACTNQKDLKDSDG